ncbi:MAG: XdhC family protein [Calditrichia bacterium]
MKEIIEETYRLCQKGQPFVLATVVATRGSTPQKAGAKLLIRSDGSALGTLGGGCVEGDMWHLAVQLLKNRSGPVYRKYELKEEISGHGGPVCGGTMHIFIDPVLHPQKFTPLAQKIKVAIEGGPAVALVIVLADESGPAVKPGTKLLIFENGEAEGSLGNSALKNEVVKAARKVAAQGDNKLLKTESGAELYIEGFTTPPTLILIGAGHVNKAIARLAATMGFRIFVVDDREEFANKQRFPEAEQVFVSAYEDCLKEVPLNSNTFIVVATRGHRFDDLALAAALKTKARYVGLMGSKRKTILIYKNLLKEGIPLQKIQKVHAPIGLNIGALTPEELAVSVMGEIIMVRHGGDGAPLGFDRAYLKKVLAKK